MPGRKRKESACNRYGPQGNMTSGLGVDKDSVEKTVYDLIIGEAQIEEIICKEVLENLDVLPTNIDLQLLK